MQFFLFFNRKAFFNQNHDSYYETFLPHNSFLRLRTMYENIKWKKSRSHAKTVVLDVWGSCNFVVFPLRVIKVKLSICLILISSIKVIKIQFSAYYWTIKMLHRRLDYVETWWLLVWHIFNRFHLYFSHNLRLNFKKLQNEFKHFLKKSNQIKFV